jgi:uncharacterized membrane protein
MTMRAFRHTIWIARTPEEVFDFFVDFSRAARWRLYVRSIERLDQGPLRVGSRLHVTIDLSGSPYELEMEVLAVQRPTLWRHRTYEGDVSGYVEYRFDKEGAGTRVTMSMEVKPKGLYGWLVAPLLFFGRKARYREQLPQLKREMELSPAIGA